MRRQWIGAAAVALVASQAGAGDSWWTSREPARWNAQIGGGLGVFGFEESWRSGQPGASVAESRDGMMAAWVMQGMAGWTHPSGCWGLEAGLAGGPRLKLFEPEETTGSFLSGRLVLRWDPFFSYQFAPFWGLVATATSVERRDLLGASTSGFFADPEEAWGSAEQRRRVLSLGVAPGLRLGWFEMQSDLVWPLLSAESRHVARSDSTRPGGFERNLHDGDHLLFVYTLRIPIRAFDGGEWGARREAIRHAGRSAPKPHAFSVGFDWFRIPAAWEFGMELDDVAGGSVYGGRARWDIASPSHLERGLVLGLFQGIRVVDRKSSVPSRDLQVRGADAGIWWDPLSPDILPVRLSGTLGFWSANASTAVPYDSSSEPRTADWWGVRASGEARLSLGLFFGAVHLDLDRVRSGQVEVQRTDPVPRRRDGLALGTGAEMGLLYRF